MTACKSFVKSVVIPYECIRENANNNKKSDTFAYDLVPVTYSLVDRGVKNVSWIYSTIECNQRNELSHIFDDDKNELVVCRVRPMSQKAKPYLRSSC